MGSGSVAKPPGHSSADTAHSREAAGSSSGERRLHDAGKGDLNGGLPASTDSVCEKSGNAWCAQQGIPAAVMADFAGNYEGVTTGFGAINQPSQTRSKPCAGIEGLSGSHGADRVSAEEGISVDADMGVFNGGDINARGRPRKDSNDNLGCGNFGRVDQPSPQAH